MTERTDQLLLDACCTLVQPPKSFSDLQPWREYREQVAMTLKLLDKRLADADREEYEALQRRMSELSARLTGQQHASEVKPAAPAELAAAKSIRKPKVWKCGLCERTTDEEVCPRCKEMTAPPSYSETDAGSGVGGREPPMTIEAFHEQLQGLRDRVTDRRARLGLA